MGSFTPNYRLWKPTRGEGGAQDNLVDVAQDVQANNAIIDTRMTQIVCTSGTRPLSPRNSELIYETDTGKAYRWNASGSTWVLIGTRDGPNGDLAQASQSADYTFQATEDAYISVTPSFLIRPERYYTIYVRTSTITLNAAVCTFRARLCANLGAVYDLATQITVSSNWAVSSNVATGANQLWTHTSVIAGSGLGIVVPTQMTFSVTGVILSGGPSNITAVHNGADKVGNISIRDAGEV